jgi:hypothetical protein
MKKKIFIGIAISLFSVATVINITLSGQSNSEDISLDEIIIMEQAGAEVIINPPWEKVCHPSRPKCTWRAISSHRSCRSDWEC